MNKRAFAKQPEREIPGWPANGWVSADGGPAMLAEQGGEKVSIRVAINARGNAGILAVLFDGQERFRETLF